MKTCPISRAQADQRKGRAGRERSGKCWRLYTEPSFEHMEAMAVPEIQRVDLAQVVLQLKMAGIRAVESFEFLAPPSRELLKKAFQTLLSLQALDKKVCQKLP